MRLKSFHLRPPAWTCCHLERRESFGTPRICEEESNYRYERQYQHYLTAQVPVERDLTYGPSVSSERDAFREEKYGIDSQVQFIRDQLPTRAAGSFGFQNNPTSFLCKYSDSRWGALPVATRPTGNI